MRMHWCDECGEAFDTALPMCRQIGCRARVCRRCRDENACCLACVREQAKLAAAEAARQLADRAALIGIAFIVPVGGDPTIASFCSGPRVEGLYAAPRCPITGEPADECEHHELAEVMS